LWQFAQNSLRVCRSEYSVSWYGESESLYGPRLTDPGSTTKEAFCGSRDGVSCSRAALIVWQRSLHDTSLVAIMA